MRNCEEKSARCKKCDQIGHFTYNCTWTVRARGNNPLHDFDDDEDDSDLVKEAKS
jgi:hypothetical protein